MLVTRQTFKMTATVADENDSGIGFRMTNLITDSDRLTSLVMQFHCDAIQWPKTKYAEGCRLRPFLTWHFCSRLHVILGPGAHPYYLFQNVCYAAGATMTSISWARRD